MVLKKFNMKFLLPRAVYFFNKIINFILKDVQVFSKK